MTSQTRHDDSPDEHGEYDGPRRRRGERDHKKGNGITVQGPTWIGSLDISGPNVVLLLAFLLVAAAGYGILHYMNRIVTAQTHTLDQFRERGRLEHLEILHGLETLRREAEQTRCLNTMSSEEFRREALRSGGDLCAYIGVTRPRPSRRGDGQ